MRKSIYRISIALIILVLASLACGLGGKEEPTATPVPPAATQAPPPTSTPEPVAPAGNMVSAESETLGVRLSYPEDWFYDDSFFIVLSSVPDADISGEEMPEGVVIFIIAGPSDEMEMEGSPEDIVEEEFGEGGDMEFLGDPVETTINGIPVTLIEFRATEAGETIHGKVAIYDNGEQAAGVMAFGPEELWDEHAAAVDAILESIELFGLGHRFGHWGESKWTESRWTGRIRSTQLWEVERCRTAMAPRESVGAEKKWQRNWKDLTRNRGKVIASVNAQRNWEYPYLRFSTGLVAETA